MSSPPPSSRIRESTLSAHLPVLLLFLFLLLPSPTTANQPGKAACEAGTAPNCIECTEGSCEITETGNIGVWCPVGYPYCTVTCKGPAACNNAKVYSGRSNLHVKCLGSFFPKQFPHVACRNIRVYCSDSVDCVLDITDTVQVAPDGKLIDCLGAPGSVANRGQMCVLIGGNTVLSSDYYRNGKMNCHNLDTGTTDPGIDSGSAGSKHYSVCGVQDSSQTSSRKSNLMWNTFCNGANACTGVKCFEPGANSKCHASTGNGDHGVAKCDLNHNGKIHVLCTAQPPFTQCTCNHGSALYSPCNNKDKCGVCDSNYQLSNPIDDADRQSTCVAVSATCSCPGGTAGTGCISNGQVKCTSCNSNFYLDDGIGCKACGIGSCPSGQYVSQPCTTTQDRVCIDKQCTCDHGVGGAGTACPTKGQAKCTSCNSNYYLDGIVCKTCGTGSCPSGQYVSQPCTTTQDRVCSDKQCTCDDGIAEVGELCPTNNATKCKPSLHVMVGQLSPNVDEPIVLIEGMHIGVTMNIVASSLQAGETTLNCSTTTMVGGERKSDVLLNNMPSGESGGCMIGTVSGPKLTHSWQIKVSAPRNRFNNDLTRTFDLKCTTSIGHAIISGIELKIQVENVIYPVIGFAGIVESTGSDDGGGGGGGDALPIKNLINANGQVQIITSGTTDGTTATLVMRGHPNVQGDIFISPATHGQRMNSSNSNSKIVFSTTPGTKENRQTLSIKLPSFDVACDGDINKVGICYMGLQIINQAVPGVGFGGTFSCPLDDGSNQACYDGVSNSDQIRPMLSTGSDAYTGAYTIKYIKPCNNYPPAGSAICFERSTAHTCAFGLLSSTSSCRSCPNGAMCPGGFEARSFPGYFTIDSQKGIVEKCKTPATERCVGFNVTSLTTMCGVEYDGTLCSQCRAGYYQKDDETCHQCPANKNTYDQLFQAMWPFATILLISSLLMFLIVYYLERKDMHEKSCSIAVRHTQEFGIWVCLSAQVMASASSNPTPNLPEWISSVYSFISFFNFGLDRLVPTSCIEYDGTRNYSSSIILFTGILMLTFIQTVAFIAMKFVKYDKEIKQKRNSSIIARAMKQPGHSREISLGVLKLAMMLQEEQLDPTEEHEEDPEATPGLAGRYSSEQEEQEDTEEQQEQDVKKKGKKDQVGACTAATLLNVARIQGFLFVLMSFAFPLVTRNVLQLLHCTNDPITNQMILLDGRSPPTICWSGKHLGVGVLAILVMVIYMIAYPLLSALYLRKIINSHTKSAHRLARWEHFIGDDYKPQYYWFRHLYWLVNFSLLFVYEFFPYGVGRFFTIVVVFTAYILLLFYCRPFVAMDQWKLPTRLVLVIASILIALLDFIAWFEDSEKQNNSIEVANTYPSTSTTPSSSSSSSSSSIELAVNGKNATTVSLVVAHFLFIVCMLLPIVLPFSFFYSNYGVCNNAAQKIIKRAKRRFRRALDDSSNDETNPAFEMSQHVLNHKRGRSDDLHVNYQYDEEGSDDGWTRHYDESCDAYYLYNEHTGISQWCEAISDTATTTQTTNTNNMYGHAHEEGSEEESLEEESPEEVTQQEVGDASIHVDETTGRRYSYNEETGETEWLAASQRGATNNTAEEVPIVEVPIVEVPIVAVPAKNRITSYMSTG